VIDEQRGQGAKAARPPLGSFTEARWRALQGLHGQKARAAPCSYPAHFAERSRCANGVGFGSRPKKNVGAERLTALLRQEAGAGDKPRWRVASQLLQDVCERSVTGVTVCRRARAKSEWKISFGQNKWALTLLSAPTAPDFGSPLPQGQFFPSSGVRLADGPEGSPVCLTAFGVPPGVDISGEAFARTWRSFSGSNPFFHASFVCTSETFRPGIWLLRFRASMVRCRSISLGCFAT
jgi:hypothetical protein